MDFKKTFALTSLHTGIKILSSIVMNKIIAVYAGPVGIALIGQFQNYSSLLSSIANGSIQTGIIKKISEYDDTDYKNKVASNALFISIGFSVLVSLITFIFSKPLAELIMLDSKFAFIIRFYSLNIIFYSLNMYLISVLNGLRQIKLYTMINILLSLVSLLLVTILTIYYSVQGAIIGLILTQCFVFFISYFFIYKKYLLLFQNIKFSLLDKNIIKDLLKFGSSTLASGVIFSTMMLLVRSQIINKLSLDDAGIWEAAMKIGVYFNMIFALPIAIQYLPLFSHVDKREKLLSYLKKIFSFIIPLMILGALFIFFFRNIIINSLFSSEFSLVTELLLFVLIAEILRMLGIVFANLLISKKRLFINIINEFLMSLTFVVVILCFYSDNLYEIMYGYLIASIVYLLANLFSFRTLYKSYNWKSE